MSVSHLDAIASLADLRIRDNVIVEGDKDLHVRQTVVARLPRL